MLPERSKTKSRLPGRRAVSIVARPQVASSGTKGASRVGAASGIGVASMPIPPSASAPTEHPTRAESESDTHASTEAGEVTASGCHPGPPRGRPGARAE